MLAALLDTLGLNEKEVAVYVSLAEVGKASASFLSKRVRFPRSTVYTILDSLLKRGVISVEQAKDVTFFVANHPDCFQRLVDRERIEQESIIAKKNAAVLEAVPLILPLFKRENYSVPKLQFFEGTANVQSMLYENCRLWQSSIAQCDCIWWGYQDHHFVETYRDWLNEYWGTMLENERIQLLSNHSETEKGLHRRVAGRSIKKIPKQYQFSSTVWVLGEFVITIMTRQKPHYAFQLQDPVFAANQRLTFQMLWSLVK
jgi:sugar-specific transcriptional regulator TrmB